VTDWRDKAACRHSHVPFFAPDTDEHQNQAHDYTRAVAICGGCEVRDVCLQFALENREVDGVWGGLTPRKRDLLRRKLGYMKRQEPTSGHGSHGAIKRHYQADEPLCDTCRKFKIRARQELQERRRAS
jgi:WhiB family transcriptional regulator, redox-sensing transcriptional regulator